MKVFSLVFSCILSISSFACVEQVQKQIEDVYATGYYLEIFDSTELKLKNVNLISDYIYIADEAATNNPETSVYRAESSAAGCYGYEFVLFDQKDCRLLAFGGGYCD
jgi:hypothetical protein